MTGWDFVIIVGCTVAGFLLVSFAFEIFASQRQLTDPTSQAVARAPTRRKFLRAGFGLTLLLLIGYSAGPRDLWNLVIRGFSSDSGSLLAQTTNISRGRDGSFSVVGLVNGSRTVFVLDTGASAVLLTQDAAKAARLPLGQLIYSVDIETANGPTHAAPIILNWLSVGSITERSVSALVAQPGQLKTSLLGMTFLNRLESWEVHGDRLVMRGY